MMFALGAASTALNAISSLTSSSGPSSTQGTGFGENPFQLPGSAPASAGSTATTGFTGAAPLSPATMNAMIAAQSQSSTGAASSSQSSGNGSTSTNPTDADDSNESTANASASAAASSRNLLEQLMQRQASAVSLASNPLSFNV